MSEPHAHSDARPRDRSREPAAADPAALVSVVIRTKDRPVLLLRALATVAAQGYRPIEAVVVNDGGGDLDTAALRAALGDVALVYERLVEVGGRARAANAGIAAARGPLIAFLDDDDELLPRHVSTLVEARERNAADVVYSDCEIVDRELDGVGRILSETSRGRYFMSREFSPHDLCFENFIPLLCVLARRETITGAGGFDESFELYEDWDLFLRLAPRAVFHHVDEVTARYVQWSRIEQIAFAGGAGARAAYLRVLDRYHARFTPETIHAYVGAVHGAKALLHRRTRELETEVERLRREVDDRERALATAREQTADELRQLRSRLGEATRTLQSIADSRAWRLITAYRVFVKERLLPAGTARRRAYDRLVRPGDFRRAAGDAATPLQQVLASQVVRERFLPPATATTAAETVAAQVSVVMPTLNAGPELRVVLERLRAQRGLPPLEIVAVDSGSTDETLSLCKRFGVRVIPYPGGAFNHGVARNAGAAAAGGDYLVFMSQDAIPVGPDAVAGLVRALHADPLLAAASARQLPRSDADLFSCWQLWSYREKVLGYAADTVVGVDAGKLAALGPAERHRAAQIDNVFACVRRSAFEPLRFRPRAIAEDLDLGLRLLEGGYRIAFMSSVAAIHSHGRPPAYHLRRSFVEWLALADLLGYPTTYEWRGCDGASLAPGLAAAAGLYRRAGAAIAAVFHAGGNRPGEVVARMREALAAAPASGEVATEPSLDAVLAELGARPTAGSPVDVMLTFYRQLLASFAEFVAARPAHPEAADELRVALFKICAETIGHCLADFGRWAERRQNDGAGLEALSARLGRGI